MAAWAELLARRAPLVMGVLNLTPDSFSDGGRYADDDEAIAQAETMASHGADIIDIGGESTRPGAARIDAAEQLRRIEPVLVALRSLLPGTLLSVDTTLTRVAERALDAGAGMLNDIAAGTESDMFSLAAERGVPIVLMHMLGAPATMQQAPGYRDVVAEVRAYLLARAELAERAGVVPEHIVLDPGIGFGKTAAHNLALLAALPELVATGYPILLGASRKSTLRIASGAHQDPTLVGATCATTALACLHGVRVVRVHDVLPNRQAADVAWAIRTVREAFD